MKESLDPSDHVLRHVKKSWMQGDFIEPAAFRLRPGEAGLSVNWLEYFDRETPEQAVAALCVVFHRKGRKVGGQSAFAMLNVGDAKREAARYADLDIVRDEQPDDPSHALVEGYESANDLVAEALARAVSAALRPGPVGRS